MILTVSPYTKLLSLKKVLGLMALLLSLSFTYGASVTISSNPAGAICPGTSVTFSANISGGTASTYQWNLNGTPIGGATASTYISAALANGNQISLDVVLTDLSTVSSNSLVITVNPIPVLSTTLTPPAICSSSAFTYNPVSTPAGTYLWSRALVAGISNAAASGSNNPNEVLFNTTAAPVTVNYVYSLSANGCTNSQTVSVVVNPLPTLTSTLTPPATCNNTPFNYTPASGTTGTTFNWSRAVVAGISNAAASGSGNPAETLVNTTTTTRTATYVYSLSANGCTNPVNYNVLAPITPKPVLSSSLTASVCSNSPFSYTPTSTNGTIGAWTRAAVTGISNAASGGTGNINETLVNTTLLPVAVTYDYTLTLNGCSNVEHVVVTVNPQPYLTSTLTPSSICSNSTFNYTPVSSIGGVTANWSRASVVGISNSSATGTGNPNEVLVNTTTDPVNVTYVYTLSYGGCSNSQNVVVTVNPKPVLSNVLTFSVCSNSPFNYTPLSATAGTTFAWSRAAVVGISNPASSGTNNPGETLVNTTTSPVAVTYVFTLTANSCVNTQNVTVTVNPIPALTSILTAPTNCANVIFNYAPTSATLGTLFSWSRAAVAGISNPAGAGTGNPNEILVNTSNVLKTVTYVYTLLADGCTNTQNVTVDVNPQPVLTSTLSPAAICNNSVFSYTPTSNTIGTTYAWTRATVAGISNAASSGVDDPNEVLVNTTTSAKTVSYIYTLGFNGCSNSQTVNVSVNPTPSLSSSLTPPQICSGTVFSYTPTSSNATISGWTRASVPGISNPPSNGTFNPNEVLTNTTNVPVNVVYVYTLNSGGCSGTANVTVKVNPAPPVLTSTLTPPEIFCNTLFSYTPTSSTPGATFAWSRAAVAGISNFSATGTGNPNEILINTTSGPIVVTYVYTLSINGCSNPTTYSVTVTVNPSTSLTSTLTPPAVCSNSLFSYTPTCPVPSTTFTWTRAAVPGISNPAASGNGNAYETLVNTTASPVSVIYVFTLNSGSCSNSQNVTVVVNPLPTLTSDLTPPTICNNTAFNYVPTSATPATTFSWSRSLIPGISNAAASGANNPNETLVNTTTNPVNVTYTYTLNAGGCSNIQYVVETVNPYPVLTSTLTPPAICSNTKFSYVPTSSTAGATFAWSRAAVAGVSNVTANGTDNPNEILVNTTNLPIPVTYVYTVVSNGCSNPATFNVTVSVSPMPALSSPLTAPDVCSGTAFSYVPASSFSGVSFNWSRSAVAGITNAAATGTNNPNEILVNNTTAPIVVTYVYSLSNGGCVNTQNVTVTVNPTPVLSSSTTPVTICSGSIFSYSPTSTTAGTTFNWSRASVAGISNPTSTGTANPNETLVNTTALPVVVTYVYTLNANGCTNPATYTIQVTVNPSATLTSPLSPLAVCSNSVFNYIPVASNPGTTFTWSRALVAGISNAASSGSGNVSETLINTTSQPINVTYIYTLNSGSCTNVQNVVVTVNPLPTLSSTFTPPSICSSTVFNYTPMSSTVGTSFAWSRPVVSGISNLAATGTNSPAENLVNTTNGPVDVTYIYTLTASGCSNIQNVVETVNPLPLMTSTLLPPAICSNTTFSYVPTSSTAGATFTWNRPAVAGVSNPVANGTGNPNETLVNTISSPVTVTYVYTVLTGGCANPSTYNVNVTVSAIPLLSSSLTPAAICSGSVFSYTPTSSVPGVSFSWRRAAVAGITNAAATGINNPNETLINTTNAPVVVTYVYTLGVGACVNTQNVTVTVNPSGILTSSTAPVTICSGSTFSYVPTSSAAGTIFNWSRSAVSGVSNPSASGTGNPNETLVNTTMLPVVVSYIYTLSNNGCTNPATYTINVTVNPAATLTSSSTPMPVCSNSVFNYTPASSIQGTTFTWMRALTNGISNPASIGAGNISETLVNSTTLPVNVTYIYTLISDVCTTTANVTVTVNPSPSLSSQLTPAAVCNGGTFSYVPASTTAGATFTWSRPSVTGISNGANSGTGNPNETLTNTTSEPVAVTYVYNTNANGCNRVQNVVVNVNPIPVLTSTTTPPFICSGSQFVYTPQSATSGTTFAWSRAAVAGIANPSATGTGNPNEVLLNMTTSPVNVTYVYTLSANGCTNPVAYNVVVTVNPAPSLSSSLTPPATCSGAIFNYTPTSSTIGASMTWTRAMVSGIVQPASNGAGNVSEILTNSSSSPINVAYQFTLYANGCSNTQNVVVTVNPTPTLNSNLAPAAICSGSSFNYIATSATPSTTFSWRRTPDARIVEPATTGSVAAINETLTNSTLAPVNVIYVYTLTAFGCANPTSYNVVVTVNPKPAIPVISPAGPVNFCTGGSVTLSSSTASSYRWSTGEVTQSINVSTAGTYYVVVADAVGCQSSPSATVSVTTLPSAAVFAGVDGLICAGNSFTISGATVSNQSSYVWSTSGTGTFNNAGLLNPTYTPSVLDQTTGSVTLTLTAFSVSPCTTTVTDDMVLKIQSKPTVFAGADESLCYPASIAITDATATNYQSLVWSITNGTGVLSGLNSLTPTYIPGASDVGHTVTLRLTANSVASCATTAYDEMNIVVGGMPGDPGPITSSSPAGVCRGTGASVTFSILPIAGITNYNWTLPTGATLVSGGNSNIIRVSFGTGSSSGNISVYGSNSCGNGPISSLPVVLSDLPTNPGSITGTSPVCQGKTGVVYSVAPVTGAISYIWSLPSGAIPSGGASLTTTNPTITVDFGAAALSGNVTVYATNSCGSGTSATKAITINPMPVTPIIAATGSTTFCEGGSVLLNGPNLGIGYTYLWSPGGVTTQNDLVTTSGTYRLVVTNSSTGCSSAQSNSVTVTATPAPAPPISIGYITFCWDGTGAPPLLDANNVASVPPSSTMKWYDAPVGGNLITAPTLNKAGAINAVTYYAEATDVSTGCKSLTRTAVKLMIVQNPAAPVNGPDQIVCQQSPIQTLTATTLTAPPAGTTIFWYTTPTGGAPVSPTLNIAGTRTYYAEANNGTCASLTRSPGVTLTINAAPAAPTSGGNIIQCVDKLNQTYTATASGPAGSSVTWWTQAQGGSIVVPSMSSSTVNSNTFYAESKDDLTGCTSLTRTAVTISIIDYPAAPTTTGDQVGCQRATALTLTATATAAAGSVLRWFTTATGGTPITGTPTLTSVGTITYYAESYITASGCASFTRTPVKLTINPAPAVPTSLGNITQCSLPTIQTLTAAATAPAGSTVDWYTAATGGTPVSDFTWSQLGATSYYAESRDNLGCVSTTRTRVILTINPSPDPPTLGNVDAAGNPIDVVTACEATPLVTLTAAALLPATAPTGTTIRWYNDVPVLITTGSQTRRTVGTSVYYAESYIAATGCASPSTSRLKITLTVNPAPPRPTSKGNITKCAEVPAIIALNANDAIVASPNTTTDWFTTATGGDLVTLPTLTEVGTITYYGEAVSASQCRSLQRTPVILTIRSAPAPLDSIKPQIACATTPIQTLTALATTTDGSALRWFTVPSGGTAVLRPTLASVGQVTYYAEAYIGTCVSPRMPAYLQINAAPSQPTSKGNLTKCAETLTAIVPFDANTQINNVSGVGIDWFNALTGGDLVPQPVLADVGTVTYYAEAKNLLTDCRSTRRTAVTLTINSSPAPLDSLKNITECATSPLLQTLTATAVTTDGSSLRWFSTPTGGVAVARPTLNSIRSVTYYAEAYKGNCVSPTRMPMTLTINALPAIPVSRGNLTVCASDTVIQTLDANTRIATPLPANTGLDWFTTPTGGTPVSPTLSVVGTVTYYAEGKDLATDCRSVRRTAVTLTINETPAPPAPMTDLTPFSQCRTTPIQTLTAKVQAPPPGVTNTWYDAATGGKIVTFPVLNTVGTVSYYAEARLGNCISTHRTKVTLTIYPSAANPVYSGTTNGVIAPVCEPDSVNAALYVKPGSTTTKLTWYDALTAGNLVSPIQKAAGSRTVYADVVDTVSGCPSTRRLPVVMTVNSQAPPVPKTSTISECAKTPLQTLDARNAITNVAGLTVIWYDKPSGGNVIIRPTLNAIKDTIFYAAFKRTGGCESLTRTAIKLSITSTFASASSNSPVALGQDIKLFGGPPDNGRGYTYIWTDPRRFTYTGMDQIIPNATSSMSGTYRLTVTDATGCSSTDSTKVSVNTAKASYQQPCLGGTLYLSGAPDNMKYVWSGPNGYTSSEQNPAIYNVTAAMAGRYKLQVFDSNGAFTADSITVAFKPLPIPLIGTSTVCPAGLLQLAGNPSGMVSYTWTGPGGGLISNLRNPPPMAYPIPADSVRITLTVKDANGCEASISTIPLPFSPKGSYNSPLCSGDTLKLRGEPSGMLSYTWRDPSGNTISTQQSPSIKNVTVQGVYTLTVRTTAGCTYTTNVDVKFSTSVIKPTILISPNPACEGKDVTLQASPSGMTTYEWSGPSGFTSTDQNPVIAGVKPANAGAYNLKVTNGCASYANPVILTVNSVTFVGTYGPYCASDSKVTILTNQTGVVFTGPGMTGNVFDPAKANMGINNIQYSYNNGQCTIDGFLPIEVYLKPTVIVNASALILKSCTGTTADLTLPAVTAGSSAGLVFTYFKDAKGTQTLTTPKTVGAGTYFIKGTSKSGKCFDIQSAYVGQPDSLRASLAASSELACAGDTTGTLTVNVTLGTAPYNYMWSTKPVQNTATAKNLRAGIYTVVVTDAKKCVASFTGEVKEPAPIKLGFAIKNIQCMSDANGSARVDTINGNTDVTFLNTYKYKWFTNPIQTAREAVRLTSLWHRVNVTDPNGCVRKDSVFIGVLDTVHPLITCPKNINLTVEYIKDLDPNKYTVDLGKPLIWDNCAIIDTAITNDAPAKFRTGPTTVIWTVTDQVGLIDSCHQQVYIKEIPSIPQLISPNNDGVNDKFVIDGLTAKEYRNSQLLIFTRSGQLVFQSNNYEDPANAWDGKYSESTFSKNQLVAPGVYYYILKLGGSSSQTLRGYVYVYY